MCLERFWRAAATAAKFGDLVGVGLVKGQGQSKKGRGNGTGGSVGLGPSHSVESEMSRTRGVVCFCREHSKQYMNSRVCIHLFLVCGLDIPLDGSETNYHGGR